MIKKNYTYKIEHQPNIKKLIRDRYKPKKNLKLTYKALFKPNKILNDKNNNNNNKIIKTNDKS
jgi:hypothetical protein